MLHPKPKLPDDVDDWDYFCMARRRNPDKVENDPNELDDVVSFMRLQKAFKERYPSVKFELGTHPPTDYNPLDSTSRYRFNALQLFFKFDECHVRLGVNEIAVGMPGTVYERLGDCGYYYPLEPEKLIFHLKEIIRIRDLLIQLGYERSYYDEEAESDDKTCDEQEDDELAWIDEPLEDQGLLYWMRKIIPRGASKDALAELADLEKFLETEWGWYRQQDQARDPGSASGSSSSFSSDPDSGSSTL